MKTKEVKVKVPEGYEIDRENSTFECIKFKPKKLTYRDVAKALFRGKVVHYMDQCGRVSKIYLPENDEQYSDPNNCVSRKQVGKLIAFNKLINVAKYLNGDWTPNFSDYTVSKFFIKLEEENLAIIAYGVTNFGSPCFRTRELAEQAIEILGEETVRLALSQV